MTRSTVRGPHKFHLRRLSVRLFCLLAVVVLGILGLRAILSPLPSGAFPVLSTAEWAERASPTTLHPHYVWLANGDVAYLQKDAQGLFEVRYQKMSDLGAVGKARPGPKLPVEESASPFWGDFFPSPDEQWVAYRPYSDNNQTGVVSADGQTRYTLTVSFESWFSDSRSFVATSTSDVSPWAVHHLDSRRTESIPSMTGFGCVTVSAMAQGPDLLVGKFARDPRSSVEVEWLDSTMTLRSLHLSPQEIVTQQWPVQIPRGAEYGSVSASPDNRYLLWSMRMMPKRPPIWVQWLWRVNPNWFLPNRTEMRYFVSDIHGGDMHSVLNRSLCGTGDFAPLWTPDSKHVSFIYHDQLYLAPID